MRILALLFLMVPALLLAQAGSAQSATGAIAQPTPGDSARAASPVKTSASPVARAASPAGSQALQDSLAEDSLAIQPKSRGDSVIVVKHSFDHREQIITGSVIMSCLVVMLVAMNNYNPR